MDGEDLAALCARLARRLTEAERPVLAEHGLLMWGYIALSHLAEQPASTQSALAEAIRYDKTRLIAVLDELENQGLIERRPDPADRRAHRVRLTSAGKARHAAAQAAIRTMETEVLSDLSSAERETLRDTLTRVAGHTRVKPVAG